ncbi:MAG: NADH oxidase [Thalassolituus sp.]|jgi:2,4-dienoyl-CoA reductase-like NADH-dependent reductase (Old Yellow Enzyme family)|uniref:NADH:flavin oxidoreductase/NADH oxidase family protein n=1 Tax=uncultured Thalassolituus sp. TaxID=285273 RepID=UPI0026200EAF|nr:NADH:flavin oxidoreductase/NADH oxidase family protein [uncultured Thalassolituus sp.]TNC92322.1 MAG: NADH oxidase [Thalassolituus sp.]
MNTQSLLGQPLTLRNGSVIPNRFAKSALSETLGSVDLRVTKALPTLYRRWAEGGVGLSFTGNVMIDRRHLGEPNNVVLEDDRDMPMLKAWAEAARSQGGQVWMQLNHPGKQTPKMLNNDPMSPSAIPFRKEMQAFFGTPRAMTDDDIQDCIQRFGNAAGLAKEAGFDGVQIHGAHGYLVSQFLSPHHNQREDQWGGSIENRMRFVVEVYKAMRAATGDDFNIGIKMNSADFQRGGFNENDAATVAKTLADLGIDLIEISGGTYETPAMAQGSDKHKHRLENTAPVKESTRQREAYFLEFAEMLRTKVDVPLMVTGGFRTAEGMAAAIESGACDLVGLGRPLCVEPDLVNRILAGEEFTSVVRPIKTGVKMIDKMALMEVSWYERQLHRMGKGKAPRRQDQGFWSLLDVLWIMTYRGIFNRVGRLRAS